MAKGKKKLYDKRQQKKRETGIEKKPRFLEIVNKNDLFEYWFKLRLKIREKNRQYKICNSINKKYGIIILKTSSSYYETPSYPNSVFPKISKYRY